MSTPSSTSSNRSLTSFSFQALSPGEEPQDVDGDQPMTPPMPVDGVAAGLQLEPESTVIHVRRQDEALVPDVELAAAPGAPAAAHVQLAAVPDDLHEAMREADRRIRRADLCYCCCVALPCGLFLGWLTLLALGPDCALHGDC